MTEASTETAFDRLLDVSGLNCPLPVLKSKAQLAKMDKGEVLKVISTHPDSQHEFPSLCRVPELDLIEQQVQDQSYIYYIRKAW